MATIPPLTTGYTLEEAEQDIADLRGDVDGMNEVLSLLDGPIPNVTPISGCQLYSTNGQPGYVNFTALTMSMMGAQPATFPGTTATAATLTSVASFQIPAGDADVGAVYELEVWGNGIQGTTGNRQALTMTTVFAGNSMASITFGTGCFENVNLGPFRWHARVRVICNTTGLTGTWTSYIDANVTNFSATATAPGQADFGAAFSCESSGTTTVDTTSAETFGLSVSWGSVTGGPTLTSRVQVPKRLC